MSLESPLNTALDFDAISESTHDTHFPILIDQPRSQIRGWSVDVLETVLKHVSAFLARNGHKTNL